MDSNELFKGLLMFSLVAATLGFEGSRHFTLAVATLIVAFVFGMIGG